LNRKKISAGNQTAFHQSRDYFLGGFKIRVGDVDDYEGHIWILGRETRGECPKDKTHYSL